ncbi:MAG: DUF2460 domain-containing protein [Bryobacteraceae bacterium]
MAQFPALKTGAHAQYPLTRIVEFGTSLVRFLDGSEQRFPERKAALRRWAVRLDLLNEGELQTLEDFFVSQHGRYGEFTFVDPWDETPYAHCSFETEGVGVALREQFRGSTVLHIRQNWS